MICKKPFISTSGLPHGCGQCLPCRIQRRRLWVHRLLLEQTAHEESAFVTLTYESCPDYASLVPKDLQDFWKRLRKVAPNVRYYAVGEYGDLRQRPHYHAIIFGLSTCLRGRTDLRLKFCCPNCVQLRSIWQAGESEPGYKRGSVELKGVGRESINYVCGYVTKKLNGKDDYSEKWLNGRFPERSWKSQGIGKLSVPVLSEFVTSELGTTDLIRNQDVPKSLRHGNREMPLGRYLRQKIREYSGLDHEKIKQENIRRFQKEMSELLETKFVDPKNKSKSFKKLLQEENKQKILNIESRHKIRSQKG